MASSADRKILIAMDGSKHAEYALRYFKQNLYKEGDDVIVVYAAEPTSLIAQPIFSADPQAMANLFIQENREIEMLVTKLTNLLAEVGVKGRVQRVSANTPGEAVVQAANDLHVQLIVTGTRGQSKLRRTLMGSVSQYILHHAHVPVLVCRSN